MGTIALGPTMAGGLQPIVDSGYALVFLPDVNNHYLQKEGEPPVFYYVPNQVRIARKEGPDKGDFLFNLVRFAGAPSDEGTIGGTDSEVAGGVLTFTITGAVPPAVLKSAEDQIIAQYGSSDDHFWGIRSTRRPNFRPAIVMQNITSISNVSPTPRGLPGLTRSGTRGPASLTTRGMATRRLPDTVRSRDAAANDTNIDPWFWNMQGQGSGSMDPTGQNAFSALIGAYPTAIMWEGFHGTAAPVIAMQAMKLKMWSPVVELRMDGEWSKIFEHFSAHLQAHYLFASVDIKAEFNRMRAEGLIEVELKVDPTIPGGAEIAKTLDQRSDLVFTKFMDAAQRVIFEPPQTVPAADASSPQTAVSPWGVGLALKYRRDETTLKLHYHETRQEAFLQDHLVSSSLSGMYDEIRADPDAERKYFLSVPLDDWPRKLARITRPVAAWSDGDVEFMDVQFGYPNQQGALMWEGHMFGRPDPDAPAETWKYQIAQKPSNDVANPPEGWTPDITFVKRTVHAAEPPDETQNPYKRIQIDNNMIPLDPEPNGTPLNNTTIEVRADSAGRLAVGPISLGVVLTDASQQVEVVLEVTDDQGQPTGERPQVRFRWTSADYATDRTWKVFTADPDFRPFYRYKVSVTVKGTLFEPGRAWEGPWVTASGNGPLTIDVPRPGGDGVTTRSFSPFETEREAGIGAPESISSRSKATPSEPVARAEDRDSLTAQGWPLTAAADRR